MTEKPIDWNTAHAMGEFRNPDHTRYMIGEIDAGWFGPSRDSVVLNVPEGQTWQVWEWGGYKITRDGGAEPFLVSRLVHGPARVGVPRVPLAKRMS